MFKLMRKFGANFMPARLNENIKDYIFYSVYSSAMLIVLSIVMRAYE